MVPSKMATKVPISTMPLPHTISLRRRCWGRMLYLTGPKKVDSAPMAKSRDSRTQGHSITHARAADPMMATSANLIRRIRADFSNLSAS